MMGDSQSETRSSLLEDTLNISFEDINYSVRNKLIAGGRKTILHGMCGSFNGGELSVIVGQSGAGKSTLMDILSGYTAPTSGRVLINGRQLHRNVFRKKSCYILQGTRVQEMLTPDESLRIAAELKLGNHVSEDLKKQRVDEITTCLGLDGVRGTRVSLLSGGQKKRLSIGLELVSDPPVMFLDEPTSGQDSCITKQIVYLLRYLARQGRTIVLTMHQPSATVLHMVDRIYTIVSGRCAYIGSISSLQSYLQKMNLLCPPYNNPVDFLIEISIEKADDLVLYSRNGRNMEWVSDASSESNEQLFERHNLKLSEQVYLSALPPPKDNPTRKILMKIKSTYSTSFWKQFLALTRRTIMSIERDPSFTVMIISIHCCIALFIGCLFYDIAQDAKYVRDNYCFLNFSLMFLMFTAFSSVTIKFPEQFPVVRREHFNCWYSTGAYYSATLISSVPTQTFCTVVYATITYWLTGQPLDYRRFLTFTAVLLMVSYVALCIGLLNGSLFNIKHAVIFGPFFIAPFTTFSGFFLRLADSHPFFHWIFHISFLKHGLVGLTLSIFGLGREKLPCSDVYCHYAYPQKFLKDNGMDAETYTLVFSALAVNVVIVICLAYFILNFRLKKKW